jgi:hypothetical protein
LYLRNQMEPQAYLSDLQGAEAQFADQAA